MISEAWKYLKDLLGLEEKKEPKPIPAYNCGTMNVDPWEWRLMQTENRINKKIDELEKKIEAQGE